MWYDILAHALFILFRLGFVVPSNWLIYAGNLLNKIFNTWCRTALRVDWVLIIIRFVSVLIPSEDVEDCFWKKLANPNQFGKYFIQIRRFDLIESAFKK